MIRQLTGNRATIGALCIVSALLLVLTTACSGNGSGGSDITPSVTPEATREVSASPPPGPGSSIDWEERIAGNKEAGKITYVTGFNYSASSPDINAVIADELGYFRQLGLQVEVIPGIDPEGIKLLSAGTTQFAGAGSASLVIQAAAIGAELKGIGMMSQVGLGALMVMEDSDIQTAKDLEGKTVGFKNSLPSHFKAMFRNAGADIAKIKLVGVGFDPTILATGDVDAVTVFKSNEPQMMEDMGYKVRLLDPGDYDVTTSFGIIAVNGAFAARHPQATEDFLRALLKAHEFIAASPDEAVAILEARSVTGYNVATEANRLKVELDMIAATRIKGRGIGWQTKEHWQKEIDLLASGNSIPRSVQVDEVMDNSFIARLYDGEKLIWME